MATVTRTYSYSDGAVIVAAQHNTNENTLFDLVNGNIDNANIKANAGIVASKLNLATVAQSLTMSSSILKFAKGADVASAGTMTLGDDGNFFDITGTTTITSITAKTAGTVVFLQFDGVLTLTDGSNLKLNGNLVTAAETVIALISDGTNWFEVARNSVSTRPYFSAYRNTSAQTINNSSATKVQLNAEAFDSGTVFDSATNFRFTPGIAGKYQLNGSVQWADAEDQQLFEIFIYKNGASIKQGAIRASGTGSHVLDISATVDSDDNDYFELYVSQSNGAAAARNVSNGQEVTYFDGCRVD